MSDPKELTMISIFKPSKIFIKEAAEKRGRTIRAYMTELFNKDTTVVPVTNSVYKRVEQLAEAEGRTISGLLDSLIKQK